MPISRFDSPLARLGLVALMATPALAAPRDFNDDFNDGLLQPAFLLDRDGDLTTTLDQTPEPLWFVIQSSSESAFNSLISIDESRRRGDLRFSSRNNNATFSVTGYSSFLPDLSVDTGAFEGWTFDAFDPYIDPLHYVGGIAEDINVGGFNEDGPRVTYTASRAAQINTVSTRVIGSPTDFVFSVEMRMGHRSGIRDTLDPVSFDIPGQGLAIILSDIEDGPIGYTSSSSPVLNDRYIEIYIENTAADFLELGIRQYIDLEVVGAISPAQPYVFEGPGGKFDGRVRVEYDNEGNSLEVTFIDRRGRIVNLGPVGTVIRRPNVVVEEATTQFAGVEFIGACCFEDNSCIIANAAQCAAAGGEYRFTGSNCTDGNCTFENLDPAPDPAIGACCMDDMNSCIEVTAVACVMMGGTYTEDLLGCNGACTAQYEPGEDLDGDGFESPVFFEECPRLFVSLVAYAERPAARINARNARFDEFLLTESPFADQNIVFQLDGNQDFNLPPVADFNGDGVVTAADTAAALTAFPPSTDEQIAETVLGNPTAPDPEDFVKDRQWRRAINRFYKDEILPLFSGNRTGAERRADRALLQDIRNFN